MRNGQDQYIRKETLISIVANAILGIGAAWLVFGAQANTILIGGMGSLLLDAIPTTIGASVMSTLVPSFITRKRRKNDDLPTTSGKMTGKVYNWLPKNIFVRAFTIASGALVLGFAFHLVVLLNAGSVTWPIENVLAFKFTYSVLIAAIVTPIALLAVLGEPGSTKNA